MPLCDDDKQDRLVKALTRLSTFIDGYWDLPNGSLEAFERTLRDHLNGVGQSVMHDAFTHFDPEQRRLDDGRVRVADSERRYMSTFGPVPVSRGLYRETRSGPTTCPLEEEAGIMFGFWTPMAAKAALLAVAHLPPRQVWELFQALLGSGASRSSLDRLPKEFSALYEEHREDYEEATRIPCSAQDRISTAHSPF
jgi:hypothetical protein